VINASSLSSSSLISTADPITHAHPSKPTKPLSKSTGTEARLARLPSSPEHACRSKDNIPLNSPAHPKGREKRERERALLLQLLYQLYLAALLVL
jgi:hypothetical protein